MGSDNIISAGHNKGKRPGGIFFIEPAGHVENTLEPERIEERRGKCAANSAGAMDNDVDVLR